MASDDAAAVKAGLRTIKAIDIAGVRIVKHKDYGYEMYVFPRS